MSIFSFRKCRLCSTRSFSVENFRRIFDYENRRGVYLEGRFFPEIGNVTQEIKACMAGFRDLKRKKRTLLPEYYELQKSMLNEEKLKLTAKKESLLTKEFQEICSEIANGSLRVGLRQVSIPNGKTAYAIESSAKAYFIVKQLQYNLRKLYKVKQSSRYEIICQLRSILDDPFPKYVIRTDIKDFYETIHRDNVLRKIDEDSLLTLPSRKAIRQILADYQNLSLALNGVPRGIGISAYLAELYMRKFDEAIKLRDGILFYARYVDDIVAIFSLRPNSSVTDLLPFMQREAAALGLTLNAAKTSKHDVRTRKLAELEYLGYKFTFGDGPIKIGLSTKRKTRYKKRIRRSFDAYRVQSQFNERKARRLLIMRVKFLTGNTRLLNNKGDIMVGVFHSNSLISNSAELKELDQELRAQSNTVSPVSLRNRLNMLSFQEGFSERRYHVFDTNQLGRIVELWRHEA